MQGINVKSKNDFMLGTVYNQTCRTSLYFDYVSVGYMILTNYSWYNKT